MGRGENFQFGRWSARALAGCAALLLGASCVPPDVPSRLSDPLPAELLARVEPDSVRARFVREGLSYHYLWSPKGPWAIHMLRLDLKHCDLGFAVLPAGVADPGGPGLSTVTDLVRHAGPVVFAAVNGDFFTAEGRPVGPEVAAGRLLWPRSRPAFAWQPGAAPWIGTAELLDDGGLSAGSRIPTGQAVQAQVVGGFPELLDDGRPVMELALDRGHELASVRHPRTARGVRPERADTLAPGGGWPTGRLLLGDDLRKKSQAHSRPPAPPRPSTWTEEARPSWSCVVRPAVARPTQTASAQCGTPWRS